MKIKGILAMILGWAVPGLGHAIQKKFARAALFFVSIFAMTGLGLAMGGRVYPFQTDNPLTILAFFADLGNGLFYGLSRYFHWGGGSLERATFEFGCSTTCTSRPSASGTWWPQPSGSKTERRNDAVALRGERIGGLQ